MADRVQEIIERSLKRLMAWGWFRRLAVRAAGIEGSDELGNYRRTRRQLERQITDANFKFILPIRVLTGTDGLSEVEQAELRNRHADLVRLLEEKLLIVSWREVTLDAERFALEIPAEATTESVRRLRVQVQRARFEYWERWAKIVVPILALLVALAALFVRAR